VKAIAQFARPGKPILTEGGNMKMSAGQLLAVAIAVGFAVLLVMYAPFEAAAGTDTSSQIVYGTLFDPPVIGGAAGRLDLPLLLLELLFVVFIGGAILLITGQNKEDN
jgi:hypothetical protein